MALPSQPARPSSDQAACLPNFWRRPPPPPLHSGCSRSSSELPECTSLVLFLSFFLPAAPLSKSHTRRLAFVSGGANQVPSALPSRALCLFVNTCSSSSCILLAAAAAAAAAGSSSSSSSSSMRSVPRPPQPSPLPYRQGNSSLVRLRCCHHTGRHATPMSPCVPESPRGPPPPHYMYPFPAIRQLRDNPSACSPFSPWQPVQG